MSSKAGVAKWTYCADTGAWYVKIEGRAKGPYRKQIHREVIIDLDADGHLAGFELLDAIEPSCGERPHDSGCECYDCWQQMEIGAK